MALYDPNEFPETTVETDFTLADVLAWARTKPADGAYAYVSNTNCAISQFLRDTGRAALPWCDREGWRDEGDWFNAHPYRDDRVETYANTLPYTFGAFAKRLESALA